jgi:hypothetical protein
VVPAFSPHADWSFIRSETIDPAGPGFGRHGTGAKSTFLKKTEEEMEANQNRSTATRSASGQVELASTAIETTNTATQWGNQMKSLKQSNRITVLPLLDIPGDLRGPDKSEPQ